MLMSGCYLALRGFVLRTRVSGLRHMLVVLGETSSPLCHTQNAARVANESDEETFRWSIRFNSRNVKGLSLEYCC